MISTLIIYPVVGAISGTIMGLLGGGAALIIIPAIVMMLTAQNISPQYSMQIAIGTFFSIAIVMLTSSLYTHHKHKGIDWTTFKNMWVGILIGTAIGGLISHFVPTLILKMIFACLTLIIACWLIVRNEQASEIRPGRVALFSGGSTLGLISGLVGIGSFTVPYLQKCGLDIRKSVATSTACSFVIAWIGTATYIFTGWHLQGLPHDSIGYIYLPVFLPIAITSVLFSSLGAKIAHNIPKNILKIIYSVLLIIIGIKMLI